MYRNFLKIVNKDIMIKLRKRFPKCPNLLKWSTDGCFVNKSRLFNKILLTSVFDFWNSFSVVIVAHTICFNHERPKGFSSNLVMASSYPPSSSKNLTKAEKLPFSTRRIYKETMNLEKDFSYIATFYLA